MTTSTPGDDHQLDLDRITTWLETNIGGTVTSITRQQRWRPVWFADVDRDGEILPLCVRGERVDSISPFDVRHEMILFVQLERAGIPVPHVHGWIDEQGAFVMDRVPGQSDFTGTPEDTKQTVIDEYLQILAQIHRLDVQPFSDAGIIRAASADEAGRIGMRKYEEAYRATKCWPSPMAEFVLGWCHRNPVDNHGRESVIVWDSFQFHQHNGHLNAVLDVEIGHIGDPLMDLAGLRSRDPYLRYGDISEIFERYKSFGGFDIDNDAIDHYFIEESIVNLLSFEQALKTPPIMSDYTMNKTWVHVTNIWALEILAARLGVDIEKPELPGQRPAASFTAIPHGHMAASMRALVESSTDFDQYRARSFLRLANHLRRLDDTAAEVAEADLDDLQELLGHRPATWDDGQDQLEQFVISDNGRHDAELITLLYRHNWRHWATIAQPGSALARWEPIQHLRPTGERA